MKVATLFSGSSRVKLVILSLSLLLILATVIVTASLLPACNQMNCLEFAGKSEFKEQQVYLDNSKFYKALFGRGDYLLRVNIQYDLDSTAALQAQNSALMKIKGFFANALSPYPGEISDEIECSQEYQPMEGVIGTGNSRITYLTGYYNDRLVFGACTTDQAKYKGRLVLLYCPYQHHQYELEVIAPITPSPDLYFDQFTQSLHCR